MNCDEHHDSITIDGKELKFGKKSDHFYTDDEGLANEITAEYGIKGQNKWGRACVIPIEERKSSHFAVPDLSHIKGMTNHG